MGLLADYLPSLPTDPNQNSAARQGLLQFGAALLGGKGNFGSIMGQGLAAGAGGYNSALEGLQKKALLDAQAKHFSLQNDALQAEADQNKSIAEAAARRGAQAPGATSLVSSVSAADPNALSDVPQASPAPGAGMPLSMIPQSSAGAALPVAGLPKIGAPAQSLPPVSAPPAADPFAAYRKALDDAQFYATNFPNSKAAANAIKVAEAMKPKLKEQVARTVNGQRVLVNVYDDGDTRKVEGFAPDLEKLVGYNAGGTYKFANPFTGKTEAESTITQSADNKATNATTVRGQNLTHDDAKATREQNKAPSGYRWTANGELEAIPGGPGAAAGKMTEDQAKASGWVVQAENAWKNLRTVAFDEKGNLTPAAKPGYADVVANMPGLGGLGNARRSSDRQKFVQAASSMSEAFLRAATGAGVNKEEAAQKVAEITPVWGDSEEVIQQKMDSIPLYLESLRMRAGPGAAKAGEVLDKVKPVSDLPKKPAVPIKVSSAADYDKVPTGAEYIAPDGTTRRKK